MVWGNLEKLNKYTFATNGVTAEEVKKITPSTFITRDEVIHDTVFKINLEEADRLKIGDRSNRKLAKLFSSSRKSLIDKNVMFEPSDAAPTTS